MQGTWADIQGVRTFVGDSSVAIGDQPFGDIIRFLSDYNFKDLETTNLPSSSGTPASERTFQHRDGRSVRLVQRFGPWGLPSIDSAFGSDGDIAEHQFPMQTVKDLVQFVIGGRKTDDPEKPAIMDQGKDALSEAIGSIYGKVEPVSMPSAYSKAFQKIGLAVRKTYPGCGHMKKEEGCTLCEEVSKAMPYAGAQDPNMGGQERLEQSRVNPAMGGMSGRMEQGADQSMTEANPNKGGLNPMYGGTQPKMEGSFEEVMQSPAYTSDDGLDMWNTYKEGDLEPPDEVQITLDPMTGEVMFVSYEYENSTQMPFMGTPAMPTSPFADSPKPTPLTEEPKNETSDTFGGGAGQRPAGMGGASMGQPHAQQPQQAQQQIAAPKPAQPTGQQSQPQPKPSQPSQPAQSSKPQTLSPEQLMQTPQTPEWTSPDPTSNEEHARNPGDQLQRSFRKFAGLLKATHEHYAGELPTTGEKGADVAKRLEAKGYTGSHFPGGSSTYAPGGSHVYAHDNGCRIRWTEGQNGIVDQTEHFSMRAVMPRFHQ